MKRNTSTCTSIQVSGMAKRQIWRLENIATTLRRPLIVTKSTLLLIATRLTREDRALTSEERYLVVYAEDCS